MSARGDVTRLATGRRDWLEETLELHPIRLRRFVRGNHRGSPLSRRFYDSWYERVDAIREARLERIRKAAGK